MDTLPSIQNQYSSTKTKKSHKVRIYRLCETFSQQGMRESNPVGNPHNPRKTSISSIEF